MIELRDYQLRFIADLRAAFVGGAQRVVGVAPTGSGKTVVAAHVIASALQLGHRVLFAAGRRELIDQTARTLRTAGVDNLRIIQAQRDEGDRDAPVVVGSIQTLTMPRWLGALPPFELGILDECHHAVAATWAELVSARPAARWLGLTATPERADGSPLGELFETLVPGPTVAQLTALGHLVPCRVWAGPPSLKPGELALTPLDAYQRFAAGQRAGVFCRDVAHATAELELFRAAGVPADVVTGTMAGARRDAVLAAWRSGELLVVTSVGVLTEGFDLPELGCAILARRFNHAGQYLQVAGRILRTAPGKTGATLVDLTGCAHEHGPVEIEREYSLTGKAIRGGNRDAIGQCRDCGSMFSYGPSRCPHCGAEIPIRARAAPRNTDAGVSELGAVKPRQLWWSQLQAKREGFCGRCGRWFPRGTAIRWAKGQRAQHQRCPGPALASVSAEAGA